MKNMTEIVTRANTDSHIEESSRMSDVFLMLNNNIEAMQSQPYEFSTT
jgi:hypothetical protein